MTGGDAAKTGREKQREIAHGAPLKPCAANQLQLVPRPYKDSLMWEDFKFNPGQSRGYTSFDGSQEKPYSIPHNKTLCMKTKRLACLRFKDSAASADSVGGGKMWKINYSELKAATLCFPCVFRSYSSPSYTFLYILFKGLFHSLFHLREPIFLHTSFLYLSDINIHPFIYHFCRPPHLLPHPVMLLLATFQSLLQL